MPTTRRAVLASFTVAPLLGGRGARAEADTIRIAVQPGLTYLVMNVMQHQDLIAKHARALGLPNIKAEWLRLAAGNNVNDAVIAGAVDIGATGIPPCVLILAKKRGSVDVKSKAPLK